jgi:hypothetical protein
MPMTAELDQASFDRDFDAAVGECELLSRDDATHFVRNGYVVVRNAFSKDIADAVCEQAWAELADRHGVDRKDPSSWQGSGYPNGVLGYVRTQGSDRRIRLKTDAPRALASQADLVGGAARLPHNGSTLAWHDNVIGNFGRADDPSWEPPSPHQRGWHKDGWHFRHFLDSPEQALVTVPLYADVLPQSGGTVVAADSIGPVARLLADNPQGLHPDGVQGSGYLIPGLIEQCSHFEELTGNAGDLVLLHPFVLHRVAVNPTQRPRFIANHALVLSEPMRFSRDSTDRYSLVELAVLYALGIKELEFRTTRPAKAHKPGPFRDEDSLREEQRALDEEMRAMAAGGRVTPAWGPEYGYASNQPT